MMVLTTLNIFNNHKSSKHPSISLHWHTRGITPTILVQEHNPLVGISKGTAPFPLMMGYCLYISTGSAQASLGPYQEYWISSHWPRTSVLCLQIKDWGSREDAATNETTRFSRRTSITWWLLSKPHIFHRFPFPLFLWLSLLYFILPLLLPSSC